MRVHIINEARREPDNPDSGHMMHSYEYLEKLLVAQTYPDMDELKKVTDKDVQNAYLKLIKANRLPTNDEFRICYLIRDRYRKQGTYVGKIKD